MDEKRIVVTSDFGDKIASLCHKQYSLLKSRGKPREGEEWSLLSGIVVEVSDKLEVVSLATGTKCLGASAMSRSGELLNDSHAEVVARRAFLRYLYDQIELTLKFGQSKIFSNAEEGKCALRPGVKFHFYTSHVPCGDASIVPILEGEERAVKKNMGEAKAEESGAGLKRKSDECSLSDSKKQRGEDSVGEGKVNALVEPDAVYEDDGVGRRIVDVHRTGAKCLAQSELRDPLGSGPHYHVLGAVRTKPGRGDPTLSVSCSDKLARWIYLGLQGSLAGLMLTQPIKLSSLTVGGGGQLSLDSLCRAVVSRACPVVPPAVHSSQIVFQHSRSTAKPLAGPCPTSVYWLSTSQNVDTEVIVEGRKHGCTKKSLLKGKGRLKICKRELFARFTSLAPEYEGKTYREAKDSNRKYQEEFSKFKNLMGVWTVKPEYEYFKLVE